MPFAKQNDVVQAIPRDRVNKRAGFRFWQCCKTIFGPGAKNIIYGLGLYREN